MIVNYNRGEFHAQHLQQLFKRGMHYNMRLNSKKFTFGVKVSKFLGFFLTERGIKVNLDKCEAVIQINFTTSKKEV